MQYVSPKFKLSAFNCPFCNAYAHVNWFPSFIHASGMTNAGVLVAICSHCQKSSYWLPDKASQNVGRMIYPFVRCAPLAHVDMPEGIRADYDEARNIMNESPRGAAALLRLCVQKLCIYLGESGRNINNDIGALVKKGLPIEIQQALDIVRVIGNNAVHPGELSGEDVEQIAATLFELVNQIIEDRISRPKKLSLLFSSLPAPALAGIANRDIKTA